MIEEALIRKQVSDLASNIFVKEITGQNVCDKRNGWIYEGKTN